MLIRGAILVDRLKDYDLGAVPLKQRVTLVWIDIHWAEHWRRQLGVDGSLTLPARIQNPGLLPYDRVVATIARTLGTHRPVLFAVLWTEYFGGVGEQLAAVFEGETPMQTDGTINEALRGLGVSTDPGKDEFDTVGLGQYRQIPDEILDKWRRYDR